MRYEPGDLVYPADLPRRVLCRVMRVERTQIAGTPEQMLRLEPLEGQNWHAGVSLIRKGETVLPARLGDRWRAGRFFQAAARGPLAHRSAPRPRP